MLEIQGEGVFWKYHVSLFLLVWGLFYKMCLLKTISKQKGGLILFCPCYQNSTFFFLKKEAELLPVLPTTGCVLGTDR